MRLVLALMLTAAAAAPAAPIATWNPGTDFSHYRSYSWAFANPPSRMDQTLYRQVHHAVDEGLGAHGFVKARAGLGDFAVGFTVGPRAKVHASDYGHYAFYYGKGEAALHQAWVNRELAAQADRDDTLSIDVYDSYSKHAIWHGVAPIPIHPHMRPAVIEHEVADVLSLFPPKPSCTEAPAGAPCV